MLPGFSSSGSRGSRRMNDTSENVKNLKIKNERDTDNSSVLNWPLYCGKRGIMFVSNFLAVYVIYVFRNYPILKMFLCVITL